MTDDVLVTISGKRIMGEENEDIQVIIPGAHTMTGGMHTIIYEEPTEGMDGITKNTIHIGKNGMEIIKEGLANAHMSFLNSGRRTTTCYSTPFGDFMIGIKTNDISVAETDDNLHISVDYSMDVEEQHLSDCCIDLEICSRSAADMHLQQSV